MAGVRIHDYTNEHWRQDVDIIVPGAGARVAYITVPKTTKATQLSEMIAYIEDRAQKAASSGRSHPRADRDHGALHEVWQIAELPNIQVLDFG